LLAVVIILFFWNLGQIFGIGGGGGSGSGGGFGDWLTGGGRDRDRDRDRDGDKTDKEKREVKELEDEEKKALGQTERERELMGNIIDADMKDLDTDTKLKQYLQKLRNFVQQYLASKWSRAGIRSYDQFRRRKTLLINQIEEVLGVIKTREERDKKVNEIINYNKKLIDRIVKTLRGSAGYSRTALKTALKQKLEPDHIAIDTELFRRTGKAQRRADIENHLNDVIKKQHEERQNLLEKIEENLNKVLTELNKELPRVPRGYATTRGPFIEVVKLLDVVIKQMEEVIDIDNYTLKREEQMYKDDKFLQVITSRGPI
jgi:hypothetical protein